MINESNEVWRVLFLLFPRDDEDKPTRNAFSSSKMTKALPICSGSDQSEATEALDPSSRPEQFGMSPGGKKDRRRSYAEPTRLHAMHHRANVVIGETDPVVDNIRLYLMSSLSQNIAILGK